MKEIWKDIVGYEGLYKISNLGRVKSFHNPKYVDGLVMSISDCRGYKTIGLMKNGKSKTCFVHRLVATAFIQNPNNYPEINHKDENKENNKVENLEWCTREYNMAYKSARVRQGISAGKPVYQMTIDGVRIAAYSSEIIAGKINGIDSSSIHKCCVGIRKEAGGYGWSSAEKLF